jgi:hypothetical protein
MIRRVGVAVALDVLECPAEHDRELIDVGRFKGDEAVLSKNGERNADRLVRATFGGQRDPGRSARAYSKLCSLN